MLREANRETILAICVLSLIAAMPMLLAGQATSPQPAWKSRIALPDEPLRVIGSSANDPDWIKLTILLDPCDVGTVYFQDSNRYTFHYHFATEQLAPFAGMTRQEFDRISLYEQGQRAVLGAVILPPTGGSPGSSSPLEYGIQLVRHDPYAREQVVRFFNVVRSSITADPNVRAYYFPTYEQIPVAKANQTWFESEGIPISSADRWSEGNICYAPGWAIGRLTYIAGDQIEQAYQGGLLGPNDLLITDGVPAEVPAVAGIISLSPSTPNSHVAILAKTTGIPFVYLALEHDAAQAKLLIGHRIVLRAFEELLGTQVKLIDVEGVLTDSVIQDILRLKEPPALDITPIARCGAYSRSADDLIPDDIGFFGGKASNFGILRAAVPDNCPRAVAFSFDLWEDFLEQKLPAGRTLREEIAAKLSHYRYPPSDMAALLNDLEDIRGFFTDTSVTDFMQAQKDAVIGTLRDPRYGFDPNRYIRFRSSTNGEDSQQFTGAGLYDSYSGCLADDLDGNTGGPCLCESGRHSERGVFTAIRKVFASFYNDNAFLERLRYKVNESDVGMALLVHHSTPDELELANGVATLTKSYGAHWSLELVTQLGAVSVTNPEDGSVPEQVTADRFGSHTSLSLDRRSNLVPIGATVMDWETDYQELTDLLMAAADEYAWVTGRRNATLDFEYKKAAPNGRLLIKQIREIPAPDNTPNVTPFLVNEPAEFCTFQGEYGDVFANHRLKSRWHVETKNLWLTGENLQDSFYTQAVFEYAADGRICTLSGLPSQWPQASHQYGNSQVTDSRRMDDLANPCSLTMQIEHLPTAVSHQQSPILTLSDIGSMVLHAEYATAVPTRDWTGPTVTTSEFAGLCLSPMLQPGDLLQQRSFDWPQSHISITTRFYWPPTPKGVGAGYTAPLARWVETIITGYTAAPITLRGWYSQTYRPEHHNLAEHFLFEPRLEPGISPEALDALHKGDIQLIYVYADLSGATLTTYGFDK